MAKPLGLSRKLAENVPEAENGIQVLEMLLYLDPLVRYLVYDRELLIENLYLGLERLIVLVEFQGTYRHLAVLQVCQ